MLSVGDTIRLIFPQGYLDYPRYQQRLAARQPGTPHPAISFDLTNPPCTAVDLFAIAGTLLHRSGAYHHVIPEVPSISPRSLTVTRGQRNKWIAAGETWRGDKAWQLPSPPPDLLEAWNDLMTGFADPIFELWDQSRQPPKWWSAAVALLCIADEAALDIGFEIKDAKSAQAAYAEVRLRSVKDVYTFSSADSDQVCVLPKSRMPAVGCTIRSLSHNLALLPPRGLARAYWRRARPAGVFPTPPETEPFNVLIVPMPYEIRASAFEGVPADNGKWGWFDVKPHWCRPSDPSYPTPDGFPAFRDYIFDLIEKAAVDVGKVHALVFPEVALSSQVFLLLCDALKGRPGFELLISGLFDSPMGALPIRPGNFTGMARFDNPASGNPSYDYSIREKHHRWRIERSQIESYALGSALDVNSIWWEHIDILSRSLDVFVLRGGATVTTLICEDLARSDPCQELVRGIGPNFVVALLMDGPQLRSRWPARYGTVLAEDPGSSVLTVTSLGLIRRANDTGAYPPAQQIALFQDDSGKMTEIRLPSGAHAMCLSLQPTAIQEQTLEGRQDGNGAQSWRLSGVQPITAATRNEKILAGQWP